MTHEHWEQIKRQFHAALEHEPAERPAFLEQACADDGSLRHELESLLASHEQAKDFIETPASDVAAALLSEDQHELAAGQMVGAFRIADVLATGGMGEVYLANDMRLGRKVALKLLPTQFTVNADRVRRFGLEARAASALNHPNIVTIHEIGETDSFHFIATEFVEGKTLREHMNTGMTMGEVLDVAIQVASALQAAHEAGIVHRDVKPENVMLRRDGIVKVLDFGLAKLAPHQAVLARQASTKSVVKTNPGVIMGTVGYMSPEQAKGDLVDERSDIFSLGVLIHEMIAGKTPFAGDSMSETFANLINAEPQPLSRFAANVPDAMQRIVSQTLRKNKDERYQTMKDVLTDLKNSWETLSLEEKLERFPASGNETAIALWQATTGGANVQTAETQNSFSRQIRRHKSLAALALVGIFGSAIALGAWFASGSQTTFEATVLSAPFASEKLSTNGKVQHAVISPDGKNVVYTNKSSNEKESVWLRHLETGSNVEIIPPSDDRYFGLALSPDGNFLYFARAKGDQSATTTYRVSIFGGIPQKIVVETQGWMSISPDGTKISFVRCYYREDEYCSLWIADSADGRNEKKLVSRPRPFRIGDNEFSPDGSLIAFAAGQSNNAANDFSLSVVDSESGVERGLTAEKFFNIKSVAWLPDQKRLLLTASTISNKNFRIWQISAATGKAEPLTKDSETYSALSLDKTASRLVSTRVKENFRLWVSHLENASNASVMADAASAAFAPDGKLFYSSTMSGNDEIWSVNPDGGGQRQLTNYRTYDGKPVVAPDNSAIYFASNRTGAVHVWRMNADGSNQTQVTRETGGYPLFVSPDGEWLYFHQGIDRTLWRVSTRSGQEQMALNKSKYRFALSPDGSLVSFAENIGGEQFLAIVSLADGQTVKAFKYGEPKGKLLEIAWLPDGKGVVYILANGEYRKNTLWLQPFDATEMPRRIADLGDEQISEAGGFALSPDGKSFAVVQGGWLHDAVLLKGLR